MPIYEYRCKKGHTFDVMQRFTDDALDTCEVCGASAQRVLHAPAVHFKGSGFYNTDYGTKKRSREMKEQKESAKQESKSSDTKSESKSSSDSGSGSSATSTGANGSTSSSGGGKSSDSASSGTGGKTKSTD